MDAMFATGAIIPLDTGPLLYEIDGAYATGLTTVKLKVRRNSDGFVLDWGAVGGPTFVDPTGGVTQLLEPMNEFGSTFPGEYWYELDLSTVWNVEAHDTYCVTVVEDAALASIANLPQIGQFQIVPALDDATLARKALYNNQTLAPGGVNNLELKDDDGATALARWNVKDPGGLDIAIRQGAPAIRQRVL